MAQPEEVDHGHWHGKIVRLYPERYQPGQELAMLEKYAQEKGVPPPTAEEMTEHWIELATSRGYASGTVAKVVMVSRFGDCGLTRQLDTEHGYDIRAYPECLELVPEEEVQAALKKRERARAKNQKRRKQRRRRSLA